MKQEETKFNSDFRAVLRAQGLGNLHIREADEPGASDLVVWQGRTILAWAELKVNDREVESQQYQFLMQRETEGGNAYVIRYSTTSGLVRVFRPIPEGYQLLEVVNNFGLEKWGPFFQDHRRFA